MSNKDLLIIHQGALGDFILTFPAVIRLHEYFDGIDVLCQSGLGKLAKSLGIVKNYYPLEAAYVATLFSDIIDPKVKTLLAPYTNVILFTRSEQLKQTVAEITSVPVCCISPKPPEYARTHLTKFVLENLIHCGLIKKPTAAVEDIFLDYRRRGAKYSQKVLLHAGAGSIRKRWPLSDFIEVAALLEADGLNPEFILGPAEEDMVENLQHPDRTVHALSDLLELTDLLKSAAGYIGNDSGASHLAAFLGLPTTVIFGPADPKRWTPVGRNVTIVRPELDCHPCFETEEANCGDPECLNKTTVQQVIQAFNRQYEGI
jgi:ADP-heptose:LPS heptosyltransferase